MTGSFCSTEKSYAEISMTAKLFRTDRITCCEGRSHIFEGAEQIQSKIQRKHEVRIMLKKIRKYFEESMLELGKLMSYSNIYR